MKITKKVIIQKLTFSLLNFFDKIRSVWLVLIFYLNWFCNATAKTQSIQLLLVGFLRLYVVTNNWIKCHRYEYLPTFYNCFHLWDATLKEDHQFELIYRSVEDWKVCVSLCVCLSVRLPHWTNLSYDLQMLRKWANIFVFAKMMPNIMLLPQKTTVIKFTSDCVANFLLQVIFHAHCTSTLPVVV